MQLRLRALDVAIGGADAAAADAAAVVQRDVAEGVLDALVRETARVWTSRGWVGSKPGSSWQEYFFHYNSPRAQLRTGYGFRAPLRSRRRSA